MPPMPLNSSKTRNTILIKYIFVYKLHVVSGTFFNTIPHSRLSAFPCDWYKKKNINTCRSHFCEFVILSE